MFFSSPGVHLSTGSSDALVGFANSKSRLRGFRVSGFRVSGCRVSGIRVQGWV